MSKITENDLAGFEARCRMREGQKVEVYAFNLEQLCRLARLGLWAEEKGIPALQWVMKPGHDEPDDYTRLACARHRANEALEALPAVGAEGGEG